MPLESAIIDSVTRVTRGRQLVVRNIEEEVVRALKMTAARHGRSAEAEHREILRRALLPAKDRRSIKDLLLSMPDVGDDADFERVPDDGREVDL
ncbi:MAG TPA: DNA-binding protein [Thermoanaerobaculia bacterium]|nr:DNA-binding protein [Thermoanaerobaculia bacterium]